MDARVIQSIREGIGTILSSQNEMGGSPKLEPGDCTHADRDGLPDNWKKAQGLDPFAPLDVSRVSRDGYSVIEIYANDLAARCR